MKKVLFAGLACLGLVGCVSPTGDMLKNKPEKLYKLAMRGMLPKTKLGKEMIKKFRVYASSEHPHTAQTQSKGK